MHKKLNSPIFFTEKYESIEPEKGILRGVVIVQEGEAKGHGVFLNKQFIKDVVNKGKEFGDVGVKSRFGHPNMCADALGTYLGRYKNFRYRRASDTSNEADQAIADLYIDESAKITPNGNLAEYVFKLAETAPDHFGNSIVFRPGENIRKKEKNADGDDVEVEYAVIEELHESDLVDSPAATNSLFSKFDSSELAYSVTTFLDSNPSIFEAVAENPTIIDEFMLKYKQYNDLKNKQLKLNTMKLKIKEAWKYIQSKFSFKTDDEKEITSEHIDALESEIAEKAQMLNDTKIAHDLLIKDHATLKASFETQSTELAELKVKAEKYDSIKEEYETNKAEITRLKEIESKFTPDQRQQAQIAADKDFADKLKEGKDALNKIKEANSIIKK